MSGRAERLHRLNFGTFHRPQLKVVAPHRKDGAVSLRRDKGEVGENRKPPSLSLITISRSLIAQLPQTLFILGVHHGSRAI
jgi:hypothetical protein